MSQGFCKRLCGLLLLVWPAAVALCGPQAAEPPLDDAIEAFAEFDMPDTESVNEGELAFLAVPPDAAVHHHHTEITLTLQSLADGWAEMRQCHDHLDPVPDAELVYNAGRIRDIRVLSSAHIGHVRAEGERVQLRDVRPGGRLCLSAKSHVVEPLADGEYRVQNGPFMRRFLDGYYPMRVSLVLKLPEGVRLARTEPEMQPGFKVGTAPREVHIDAWFEGKLYTRIFLRAEKSPQ